MAVNPELILPIPPRTKLRRNLFLLFLLGLAVYLFLPQFSRIEHAFEVVSTLKIPLVTLSLGAQVLSYLGSGYLLRTVVKLAAKPVSVVDGALLTAGANRSGPNESYGGFVPRAPPHPRAAGRICRTSRTPSVCALLIAWLHSSAMEAGPSADATLDDGRVRGEPHSGQRSGLARRS